MYNVMLRTVGCACCGLKIGDPDSAFLGGHVTMKLSLEGKVVKVLARSHIDCFMKQGLAVDGSIGEWKPEMGIQVHNYDCFPT